MAGGIFTAQNKRRAGVYINFQAVVQSQSVLGDSGVIAVAAPLSWGATITELNSTDFIDGKALSKIGLTTYEEEALMFRLALSHAHKAVIYRFDAGSVQALGTLGETNPLSITAKYGGVFGNNIAVAVRTGSDGTFVVDTLVKGAIKDSQVITKLDELVENDYVLFSGTGEPEVNAGVTLAQGKNGTVDHENFNDSLEELAKYQWNILAVPYDVEGSRTLAIDKIKELNNMHGRYVQAVVMNPATNTNEEAIIGTAGQGVKLADGTIVSGQNFVVLVAGLLASTPINESRTYYVIPNAVEIDGALTDSQIDAALDSGKLVLSKRQDGKIVIEKDINTLHMFTNDRPYEFSKNRVIRTMFGIARWIQNTYEVNYIGKVSNNDDGRGLLKADIIGYMNTLQGIGAIQNFNSTTDVEVLPGEQIEGVVVNIAYQPVDSMEKLYATVSVTI